MDNDLYGGAKKKIFTDKIKKQKIVICVVSWEENDDADNNDGKFSFFGKKSTSRRININNNNNSNGDIHCGRS